GWRRDVDCIGHEGFLDSPDRLALHFPEIRLRLVNPSEDRKGDRVLFQSVDQYERGRLLEYAVDGLGGTQRDRQRAGYVGFDADANFEVEPALRGMRIVENLRLVDDRIWDPDFVAVPGRNDRRPRVQSGDSTFDPFDHHCVVGCERTAKAQKNAGNIVLDR